MDLKDLGTKKCEQQVIKCLRNQSRTKSKGWSTANKQKPPSNYIAGRPKAALLFWLFSDFRSGVLLFVALLVVYKNINR